MRDFWTERTVFLTGHTGFKGAWLSLWLKELGANVVGYALAPLTQPNLFSLLKPRMPSTIGDIRDAAGLCAALQAAKPHVVIHMAAQALVKESYRDPINTFSTNVLGTVNVLQACRELAELQSVVVVTSDKVYENRGANRAFVEDDRLGGHDPYSNSKACAELVTSSFRDSYFMDGPPIATARAGNVIGGGDWSADRLIPDCVRALDEHETVSLRFPEATRPWQHVLEPLSGYLKLAQALVEEPRRAPLAVNFGPTPASFCSVREVVEEFSERFGGKPGWSHDLRTHAVEAQALTLSSGLAAQTLDWRPRLGVTASVAWTADWYKAHAAGENLLELTTAQIRRYQALLSEQP